MSLASLDLWVGARVDLVGREEGLLIDMTKKWISY